MISLTGIKGQKQEFMACEIAEVKAVPDTLLVFLNGNKVMVKESIKEVIDKIAISSKKFIWRTFK
jgi:flagellar protein FlbD